MRPALLQNLPPRRQPTLARIVRHAVILCRWQLGPGDKQRFLNDAIAGTQYPVRALMQDGVTHTAEPLNDACRGGRPKRRPKALVRALMRIEIVNDIAIRRNARLNFNCTVIRKRGIDRQPPRRRLGDETLEPLRGYKIEQSGRGDEVERSFQRKFEIADEIHGFSQHGDARRHMQCGSLRQQAEIVVEQPPALSWGQMRCDGPQRRSGAAGKINNRDRNMLRECKSYRIEYRWIAGNAIIWFSQREPFRGEAAHLT